MGRKKIEIRPLIDERNRNVTFLKRKAGLMKKAWELSVLCAADVSIMIFSSNGKPYEFSSRDLDGEIDRYLEYEGAIERRRAPEFAAMAEDEDEDEEDDLPLRRGSTSKATNGMNGVPVKTLKGKETFKARMTSRADLARVTTERGKGKGKEEKRGFIEGILDESSRSGSSESEVTVEEERPVKAERGSRHTRTSGEPSRSQQASSSGSAGLQYALNLHNLRHPAPSAPTLQTPNGMYSCPNPAAPHSQAHPQPQGTPQFPYQPNYNMPAAPVYSHHSFFAPTPQVQPLLPNNMQWDPNLLSRYAEYQLQQNHHKQQRALLERQRQQLAELGIPVGDHTLFDQLFGNGGVGNEASQAQPEQAFEWPDVGQGKGQAQRHNHNNLGSMFGDGQIHEGDGMIWPMGEEAPLPSPTSAEEVPRRDKREREREEGDGAREGKRTRVP